MIIGYDHSQIVINSKSASQAVVKGETGNPIVYTFEDGKAIIDTAEYTPGEYVYQLFNGDQIILQDVIKIKQNLKYVTSAYNPKSKNRIILQAIEAYLAGIATHQQRRVKIGDKEIEYSSYDELMKWLDYYKKQVRKEDHKASSIRLEKVFYREQI